MRCRTKSKKRQRSLVQLNGARACVTRSPVQSHFDGRRPREPGTKQMEFHAISGRAVCSSSLCLCHLVDQPSNSSLHSQPSPEPTVPYAFVEWAASATCGGRTYRQAVSAPVWNFSWICQCGRTATLNRMRSRSLGHPVAVSQFSRKDTEGVSTVGISTRHQARNKGEVV
jgi:hypothetical protein